MPKTTNSEPDSIPFGQQFKTVWVRIGSDRTDIETKKQGNLEEKERGVGREGEGKGEAGEGERGRPAKMPVVAIKGPWGTLEGCQCLCFFYEITVEREKEGGEERRWS